MQSANSIAFDSLRQSAGSQAAIDRIFLSVLSGQVSEDAPELSVRSMNVSREMMPECWARCDHNILIHIANIGSKPHIFNETRLDDLALALDAADPILCAIESLTGFIIDPIEVINTCPNNHSVFEISRSNATDRLLLAFPLEIQDTSEFFALFNSKSIDLSDMSVEYDLCIKSPSLDIDSLADLSTGDLLILGGGGVRSIVMWQGVNQSQFTIPGIYDLISGEFAGDIGNVGDSVTDGNDDTDRPDSASTTVFPVSVMVGVKGLKAEAKKLAGIQSGTVFHVGKLIQGLDVSIGFGKKDMFGGHLVQIGDQLAVSIDTKKYEAEFDVDDIAISKVMS